MDNDLNLMSIEMYENISSQINELTMHGLIGMITIEMDVALEESVYRMIIGTENSSRHGYQCLCSSVSHAKLYLAAAT